MTKRSKANFIRGKCCANCKSQENLTVDYIRPRSLGFTVVGNKQVLCEKCNVKKGSLSIDYSTRTLIVEPFLIRLSQEDRLHFLRYGCKRIHNHRKR